MQGESYNGPTHSFKKNNRINPKKSRFDEFSNLNEVIPNIHPIQQPFEQVLQLNTKPILPPISANIESSIEATTPLEPKINIAYSIKSGEVPRRIALERMKREFAVQNLESLLVQANFEKDDLKLKDSESNAYPIEVFDNTEFDARPPNEWLGLSEKDLVLKNKQTIIDIKAPIMAKAIQIQSCKTLNGRVIGYEPKRNHYLMKFSDNSTVSYPRLLVAFPSESFHNVIERINFALSHRKSFLSKIQNSLTAASELPNLIPSKVIMDKYPQYSKYMEEIQKDALALTSGAEIVKKSNIEKIDFDFAERKRLFNFLTFYTKKEAHDTLIQVQQNCNKLLGGAINACVTSFPKPVSLEEFEQIQMHSFNQAKSHMREAWFQSLITIIKQGLKNAGKGWYNLTFDDIEIYNSSKLFKLMKRILFMMEDTIRTLTLTFLQEFVTLFTSLVESTPKIRGVLIDSSSNYRSLFFTELRYDENALRFSVDEPKFKKVILSIFNSFISFGEGIPIIERHVITNMLWSNYPSIQIPSQKDAKIVKLRGLLEEAIERSFINLANYSNQFIKYIPRLELNVEEYIKKYDAENHTVEEIEETVIKHIKTWEELEREIPMFTKLGLFHVLCDSIKRTLKKEFSKAHLTSLSKRTFQINQSAIQSYNLVLNRLKEKNTCVEDSSKMKEFMHKTTSILETERAHLMEVSKSYSVLENFRFEISNEDFRLRYNALQFSSKILEQVEISKVLVAEDESNFLKALLAGQETFKDKIISLSQSITTFNRHYDSNKLAAICLDMTRIAAEVAECTQLCSLINSREALFGIEITDSDGMVQALKEFEPFKAFWTAHGEWIAFKNASLCSVLTQLDAEEMEKNLMGYWRIVLKSSKATKQNTDLTPTIEALKNDLETFKIYLPLVQALSSKGIRERHWAQLSEELGMTLRPDPHLTLEKAIGMGLMEKITSIMKVCDGAGKEYSIETALDKMVEDWSEVQLIVLPYKETGTFICRFTDEIARQLDDHIVMTQSMSFSPYKKVFAERINAWESKLRIVQEVQEAWISCQRTWLYLEPVFSSEDIKTQLPAESKRFLNVDRIWRRIMLSAKSLTSVIEFCSDAKLLESFRECNKLLEIVSKGLTVYLESKRIAFPRFFFLSDDELLQILSQTKDPTAVQPHLKKCFENVALLEFAADNKIMALFSSEGEKIELADPFYPEGPVEEWLSNLEHQMKLSIKQKIELAKNAYNLEHRDKWVLRFPGQAITSVSQLFWTQEVSDAILSGKQGVTLLYDKLVKQLLDLVALVRGELDMISRLVLGDLIVLDVHARDVVKRLRDLEVDSINDFEWISQLRYYWESDDLRIKIVNANFKYGYEYLGNTTRLVITPLTDRCYLTLTGAMQLNMGGPAGTGKTETTKDLAKAMAKQCVVVCFISLGINVQFNCSDQLDYLAMAKFFKGLAASGAWACFDEFNRINIEVLSVVAQQITVIQKAASSGQTKFVFDGVELPYDSQNAVFITMNPGYAGRTEELPDNLKALFRPMAMMIPNYAMIAEISLFSFGFTEAKVLGEKMVATFKLSSEQLSSQDHYDFGMRAVKTVISSAGNIKRNSPNTPEDLIVLRALKDCNIPKFVTDDIPLFNGIISDLFPNTINNSLDYGDLITSIHSSIESLQLISAPVFVEKCIQLYETIVVRHGLMLVGPTGGGKTSCIKTLAHALSSLEGKKASNGQIYQKVKSYALNPKSITMGQLYGEFDNQTHEWSDGILSSLMRLGVEDEGLSKKWYIFDGPVDAVWIETMNTLLDDNKKLCLTSGEIIKIKSTQTMMFEVDNLAFASPATVSRCGMVLLEPNALGPKPLYESWCIKIKATISPIITTKFKELVDPLYDLYIEEALYFVGRNIKEIIPSTTTGLINGFMKLLYSVILHAFAEQVESSSNENSVTETTIIDLANVIEPLFLFTLVWTFGVTGDTDGRIKFDDFLKTKFTLQSPNSIPDGFFYDFIYDIYKQKWTKWVDSTTANETVKCDINIVPTIDNIRNTFIMDLLLKQGHHVLCLGPTGTGKSVTVQNKLINAMPECFNLVLMNFSARTSANQSQDYLESKFEKRRKGVFGPPLGKKAIIFVDDLNMPMLDICDSQPPIELLRQWMDYNGWYDRKDVGKFIEVADLTFIAAMGPPGGGKNPVTPRFTRHFNYLSFTEMEDSSLQKIFTNILGSYLAKFSTDVQSQTERIVQCSISLYNTIRKELLPTPNKSHYTFNLRDLTKVVQGMLSADVNSINNETDIARLWVHESMRVFHDRLVDSTDKNWFMTTIENYTTRNLKLEWDIVYRDQPLLFADFASSGSDVRLYTEVQDLRKVVKSIEEYLEEYNSSNTSPMKLVFFIDAVSHLVRICRILRQPSGHALLLGVGGSGKQSLSKLATYMSEYELRQIEISKSYGMKEWKEDLKSYMMKSGIEAKHTSFLICDTQIISEACLEDINNILNGGDVPNLYNLEDMDKICSAMKPIAIDSKLPLHKDSLFSLYITRVRTYLHLILCMSPIGELFRSRLRMFPSLINCCAIDWFSAWPEEALRSVAASVISEISEIGGEMIVDGIVKMCVKMHESVRESCTQYKSEMNRTNYVTPKSYLEMLSLYKTLLDKKRSEIVVFRKRTALGLEKLLTATKDVEILQEDLNAMSPILLQTSKETDATMKKIAADKLKAEEIKKNVMKEEKAAAIKAEETTVMAEDAKRDLDEALPALDAALESLNSLSKNDVIEVRSMQRPPDGVRLVIEAVCIMKMIKPKKVDGDKPGKKVDDYWENGKAMLADPAKFLDSLLNFDKDNMAETTILKIKPYIDSPEFQVSVISRVSKAATSLCQWVRAMDMYYWVSKGVAPKRAKLQAAQESLDETMAALNDLKQKMRESEQSISEMERKYADSVAKKEELSKKVEECNSKLSRAEKLIYGLGNERIRWAESVSILDKKIKSCVGDMLLAGAAIAYLGAFTAEYRLQLMKEWVGYVSKFNIPHSENPSIWDILGDPVKLMSWEVWGLPKDSLSKDNALIVEYTQRCPLLIDPQGQANKWIKNMELSRGLEVVQLTDKDFLRTLENGIRFGKPVLIENIGETLDPALEPILLKQIFKQGGNMAIKVGDNILPYHEDFRLYLTTNLPNPAYSPEISATVTLVNFTLAPSGLEDQLLALVVASERPDLEESKTQLVINNAKMKGELKEIEDKILYLLSSVQGNPVEDERLVETLQVSKETSDEIKEKVIIAEEMEKSIDSTRNKYIPVAVRTRILFFCITELSSIDPMYQYSLGWFVNLFSNSIKQSEKNKDVEKRVENINEFFTFSLFTNVCRSLFEKHKLLFSFLLSVKMKIDVGEIDLAQWKFLLAGGSTTLITPNPAAEWLPTPSWIEILSISSVHNFKEFQTDFETHLDEFQNIYESNEPHKEAFPQNIVEKYSKFEKLLIIRCLRPDKLVAAIQEFVGENLGKAFIEPQSSDIALLYKESSPLIPIIFVLSSGADPASSLYRFAEECRFSKRLVSVSLGQGQGPKAEVLIKEGVEKGLWVLLQNCHLAPSWMLTLDKLIASLSPDKVHREFRLWLTSMPTPDFPVQILQNGAKTTIEPPQGLKPNVMRLYASMDDSTFDNACTSKKDEYKKMLLSLSFFHAVIQERRKFGALGWNIGYEFSDGDYRICTRQLGMFLEEYTQVPYKVLNFTVGEINYGGRVTDNWDRRLIMTILADFYTPEVMRDDYSFGGPYTSIQATTLTGYKDYIKTLPIQESTEIFGMHPNANMTYAQKETFLLLGTLLDLMPKNGGSKASSRDQELLEQVNNIKSRIPGRFDVEQISKKYPVEYKESMCTVLIQEVIRYNRLLNVIHQELDKVIKALKGEVVMSSALERTSNSIYLNQVPTSWASKAYPSLKPLGSWTQDLISRIEFINSWFEKGTPTVYWISGFFFPQAFLTGTLQNYARKHSVPIDLLSFDFKIIETPWQNIASKPDDGCYIRGLYIEGARFEGVLCDSKPKELYTEMSVIWLLPAKSRKKPETGFYECPVYKTLTRAGTLSTTGHSTNYIMSIELPSSYPQAYWIKRGVALITGLSY